jgi:hypothetical protein
MGDVGCTGTHDLGVGGSMARDLSRNPWVAKKNS